MPINVSLGGRREEPAPQPEPETFEQPEPEETEFYDEVYDADTADDGEAADPAYREETPSRSYEEDFSEPEVRVMSPEPEEPEEPTGLPFQPQRCSVVFAHPYRQYRRNHPRRHPGGAAGQLHRSHRHRLPQKAQYH